MIKLFSPSFTGKTLQEKEKECYLLLKEMNQTFLTQNQSLLSATVVNPFKVCFLKPQYY